MRRRASTAFLTNQTSVRSMHEVELCLSIQIDELPVDEALWDINKSGCGYLIFYFYFCYYYSM